MNRYIVELNLIIYQHFYWPGVFPGNGGEETTVNDAKYYSKHYCTVYKMPDVVACSCDPAT